MTSSGSFQCILTLSLALAHNLCCNVTLVYSNVCCKQSNSPSTQCVLQCVHNLCCNVYSNVCCNQSIVFRAHNESARQWNSCCRQIVGWVFTQNANCHKAMLPLLRRFSRYFRIPSSLESFQGRKGGAILSFLKRPPTKAGNWLFGMPTGLLTRDLLTRLQLWLFHECS